MDNPVHENRRLDGASGHLGQKRGEVRADSVHAAAVRAQVPVPGARGRADVDDRSFMVEMELQVVLEAKQGALDHGLDQGRGLLGDLGARQVAEYLEEGLQGQLLLAWGIGQRLHPAGRVRGLAGNAVGASGAVQQRHLIYRLDPGAGWKM